MKKTKGGAILMSALRLVEGATRLIEKEDELEESEGASHAAWLFFCKKECSILLGRVIAFRKKLYPTEETDEKTPVYWQAKIEKAKERGLEAGKLLGAKGKEERIADWLLEEVPYKNADGEGTISPRFLFLTSDTLRQDIKEGGRGITPSNAATRL